VVLDLEADACYQNIKKLHNYALLRRLHIIYPDGREREATLENVMNSVTPHIQRMLDIFDTIEGMYLFLNKLYNRLCDEGKRVDSEAKERFNLIIEKYNALLHNIRSIWEVFAEHLYGELRERLDQFAP